MSFSGMPILNPATNEVIDTVADTSAEQVRKAVERAKEAAVNWRNTPLHERVGRMRRLAELVRQNKDRLSRLLSLEVGKVLKEAESEVDVCARLIEGYANQALHSTWHAFPGEAQPGLEDDILFISREPLGVVGSILPFNFPLDLFGHNVAPALAVGNTVVLKPSEDAPLAVLEVAKLAAKAGIDEQVLQIIPGAEETGKALVNSDVDALSFTGSAEVGISVAEQRARRLTPTLLELGGNDVAVVLEDADIELAVNSILDSRILANGQVCCSTKRVLATGSVKSDVVDALFERVNALEVGNPQEPGVDVGPLINNTAAERVERQLAAVLGSGASMLSGTGKVEGNFLKPVLLVDVAHDNPIATDMEVFAPVLPVIHAADTDEAITVANSSRYGLNASVFSRDTARALSVARRLEAGTIAVNGAGLFRSDAAPFGGYKFSGFGRESFLVSLEELTQAKTINLRGYWK